MRAFFSSSSTTLPTPRSSNRSKRRRRTFSDDRSCFLNRRLRRRSLVVTNSNKSTTTQTLLPLRTLSPPSMKKNTIMNEVSSVSAAASRTKTATTSASPTRVPILNNTNLPIAFAIMFGFGTISAVLYPASKAMEKAMRATEIAMNETTKLMERDALRAFNEGEQASLEWQELGKELRLVLKNIEQWGKPLMGDENSLESFDLNQLGESVKDSLAEVLEKSLIGIRDMNNSYNRIEDRPQLGGMDLMQQSIDDNLFKWQDAITDVIEDLTNLTLEAASKGQTANEETLKRALNQAKVASESFLMSSSSRTSDDRGNSSSTDEGEMEVDPATNSDRKKISSAASYEKQDDDFDIRTRAASEKLKEESRAKKESMDSL